MTKFAGILCLLLITALPTLQAASILPDQQRCADPKCEKLISEGHTVNQFPSNKRGVLSFKNNVAVKVFSKNVGKNSDLWGVEISGKKGVVRGYAPSKFIQEDTVRVKEELLKVVSTAGMMFNQVGNQTPLVAEATKLGEQGGGEDTNKPNATNVKVAQQKVDTGKAVEADQVKEEGRDLNHVSEAEKSKNIDQGKQEDTKDQSPEVQVPVTEAPLLKIKSATNSDPNQPPQGAITPTSSYVVDGTTLMMNPDDIAPNYLPDTETPPPPPLLNTGRNSVTQPADPAHQNTLMSSATQTVDKILQTTMNPIIQSTVDPAQKTVDSIVRSTVDPTAQKTVDPIAQSTVNPTPQNTVVPSSPQTAQQVVESSAPAEATQTVPTPVITVIPSSLTDSVSVVSADIKNAAPDGTNNGSAAADHQTESISSDTDAKDAAALGSSVDSDRSPTLKGVPPLLTTLSGEQSEVHASPPPATLQSAAAVAAVDHSAGVDTDAQVNNSNNAVGASDSSKHGDAGEIVVDQEKLVSSDGNPLVSDPIVTATNDVGASGNESKGWMSSLASSVGEFISEAAKFSDKANDHTAVAHDAGQNTVEGSVAAVPGTKESVSEPVGSADSFAPPKPDTVIIENKNQEISVPEYNASDTSKDEGVDTAKNIELLKSHGEEYHESTETATDPNMVTASTESGTGDSEEDVDKLVVHDTEAEIAKAKKPDGVFADWFGLNDTSDNSEENASETTEDSEDDEPESDLEESLDPENLDEEDSSVDDDEPESMNFVSTGKVDSDSPPAVTNTSDQYAYKDGSGTERIDDKSPDGVESGAAEVPSDVPSEESVPHKLLPVESGAAEVPSDVTSEESVPDKPLPEDDARPVPADGGEPKEAADSGPDLHDPNSIAGRLLQTAEPIMAWLASVTQLGDSLTLAMETELTQPHLSNGVLTTLVLLAVTIVALYAVHAMLTKCTREGPLLEALNVLEHEQHVSAAVILELQHKLTTGGGVSSVQQQHYTAEVARLGQLLQEGQTECARHSERVQELEQELEESASSGLEMHAMLQDLLLSQKDTASFQGAIDDLQTMLNSQREKVESLTSDLTIKSALNDELKSESAASRDRITKLEYQLEQVSHSLGAVTAAKASLQQELSEQQARAAQLQAEQRTLTQSCSEAAEGLAALQGQQSRADQRVDKMQRLLRTKEAELQVSKECLKQLKLFNDCKGSKEKLAQMLDVIKVRSQLDCTRKEHSRVQEQLEQRTTELRTMEGSVELAQQEAEVLRSSHTQAEEEKAEALSKLAVLTTYFQEKEAQLTKELESESGLRQDAEGSAECVSSRIRDYDVQLAACRTQVTGLKKELEDQEQSYRAQLAAQEQKTHESWVAARAAERKYEESKQETGQLRSRLLIMSKDQQAITKLKSAENTNGSLSSPRPPLHDDLDGEHSLPLNPLDSPPPHMLPHLFPLPPGAPPMPPGMPFPPHPGMHPPPHPFLPPPIPPALLSDRRLPPAGRLASPPFHRRMGGVSPPNFIDRRPPSPPPYDRRSPGPYDRRSYSPGSEHSRGSDRPPRYSPHYDRQHPHHGGDRYNDRYSPERRRDSSPEPRWYNRSPDGYARKASPPRRLYDQDNNTAQHRKGKKTSTPLGPNDR